MKRSAAFFFLLLSSRLFSQPLLDVLNIKYQYFPNQYFKSTTDKRSGSEIDATLLLPLVQKDSNSVLAGINFRRINSNDELHSFSLYSFAFNLGYDYKTKNKMWSITGIFIPKISADEITLRGKNVQYGGVVLVKYKRSKKIHYHLGLYYNRELFGNYFIPLAGINWKASDRITVYGNLPASINMEYKLTNTFYTGFSYSSSTSTYALNDSFSELYVKEGEKKIGYTQFRLILNWYIKKRIVLFFEPGVTYKRRYSLYSYPYDKVSFNISGTQSKTSDNYFLMGGIAYRIRFDK